MIFLVLLITGSGFAASILAFRSKLGLVWRILLGVVGGLFGAVFIVGLLLSLLFWEQEPPSVAQLEKHFSERRSTLEQIMVMFNQDPHFSRIDPTFIRYGYFDGTPSGQSSAGDKDAPLQQERWRTYRSLFSKANLNLGVERDGDGDMFFIAGSVGLLNRGHVTGYVFCRDPDSASSAKADAFVPCTFSHRDEARQAYSDNPKMEAYSFKKMAEHWYAFDEGPS